MLKTLISGPATLGIVRHLLTIGAGALMARGIIDAAEAEVLVGAILAVVGVGFSVAQKRN